MPFGVRNSHVIQKIVKNNNGETIAYALENGEIIMKEEVIRMARQGEIDGVTVIKDENGEEYIESRVGDPGDNLISMPVIDGSEEKNYNP